MSKELSCVSFSDDKFRFARAQGLPNKKEITELVVKDILNLSDNDISEVIRTSFKEVRAKNLNVICSISSHSLMTKNIEIPSRDSKEIEEIINLQSGRYTPYSTDEIIMDYVNIGVYKQNYTKVLLIIVPQKVIKRYSEILNGAGLKIEKIFVASESICRIYPYISKLKLGDNSISVIHIGHNSTDFTVALRNKLIFARNIPIGANNSLVEREKFKQRFIEEVKKSLESYQSEDIEKTPNQIILTGAIEPIEYIKDTLDNALDIPSTLMSYFNHLPFKKDVLESISTIKEISFLDVVSPLFVSDELTINLIPKEAKLRKSFEERGRDIIKMGILLMSALVLTCAILMSKIYFKSAYLEKMALKYGSMNHETQGLERAFAKTQIIRNYLSTRGYSLEILNELHGLIPPDVYLDNIRFSEEREFSIKGTSESMSTVFALVSSMNKSIYFQNVKTKYTTKRKDENKDVTDFQITCTLKEDK